MKPSFKPRARITGYSPQLHLQAKIRFKTFWIDSDKKIFSTKIFWFCHFLQFWSFWLKKQSPTKKIYTGKNFRLRDFRFKIRFATFWIDSDQKICRPKFFNFVIFSLFGPFDRKATKSEQKNFTRKNFRFWDFCFNIRFKTFWIDSKKNFFWPKIFENFHFLVIFC